MDNLRFKKHANRRRYASVDGLMRTPGTVPRMARGSRPAGASAPERAVLESGFNRGEGFHSRTRPQMSDISPAGEAVLEQPIERREPSVRPKKQHAKRKRRLNLSPNALKWTKRVAIALVALVVLTGGYLLVKVYLTGRNILGGGGGAAALQENVDPTLLNGEGDGRVNILLLGTGGEDHDNGSYLVDTIIVASIDPIHKEAALLSIPRDFYIKTDDYGSMRINAVFKTARNQALRNNPQNKEAANKFGTAEMEKIVEQTMGIPIHYNAMIDFTGFQNAIDTVGGIEMDVPENLAVYEVMRIDGRNYTLNVRPGRQKFDGFRALAFARSRKTSRRGDFARSERQRLMLVALKDKIASLGTLANPIKVNQLLSDFGGHARSTLSVDELLRVYEITNQIPSNKIISVSLVDEPNVLLRSANIGGSVQIPRAGLHNYSEIQSFVRNTLKDAYIRQENATISIYNATAVNGLATRKADELRSYGYNILTVDNAPKKNLPTTILTNRRGLEKKYTQRYLEKRFNTTAVSSVPPDIGIDPGDADFVIILGQNATD